MTAPSAIQDHLAGLARDIGINDRIKMHLFLCCDQTEPKCCDRATGLASWNYLKSRLNELGLSGEGGICRSKVNCLRICEQGPILLIYPDGTWYHSATPDVIERIIQEHVVGGTPVQEYLFARQRLAAPSVPRTASSRQ